MNDQESLKLQDAVIACLRNVIDPETNVDVIRMQLIEDLRVEADGKVSYTFRPSSPLCPIAVSLVKQIKQAIAEVPGVSEQEIRIEGYIAAVELTQLINREV
jgi:metal-sulfur cluster biosynthetic enzyme